MYICVHAIVVYSSQKPLLLKWDIVRYYRRGELTSKAMHENNPNVADLSDVNRPSKVAERFSRLYDDLWTETCEELTQQYQAEYNGEKQAILDLAEILRVCLFRYANLHITVLLFNWQNNVYM